jgi:hypothetical protein
MIYLECNPDKALVRSLGIPRKDIRHSFSKGNVCNDLSKNTGVIGLVDEDPGSPQPLYLKKLKQIEAKHEMKLLHDEKANNYVVVLCPNLEGWIIKAAREANINLSEYDMSDEVSSLHKIINNKIGSFERLLQGIKGKSEMVKTLEDYISRGK